MSLTVNTLPIGTTLSGGQYPYRITEILGQGSYGITYKATAKVPVGNISAQMAFAIKENFAREYCSRAADGIKVVYSREAANQALVDLQDLVSEGRMLHAICNGNKNIVNVNETFRENNTAYYVMEFIDGSNLHDLVKTKGRLSEKEAIDIITPIILAVGHLHHNWRLHLDIKPENIMITKRGEPILIDFGISLHFNTDGNRTGTSKSRSTGCSDGYAPLEQYSGVNHFNPQIDVYALGATLYYMLVGKDPAKCESTKAFAKKITTNIPQNVSSQTHDAILHAMKVQQDERTQTAEDFLSELDVLPPPPAPPSPIKPISHLPMAVICTLMCLPLGLVALIYASKVDTLFFSNDYDAAQEASENADKWIVRSLIAWGVCFAIMVLLNSIIITD